jgi:hypothetical protein
MTKLLSITAHPHAPVACDMTVAEDTLAERLAEYRRLFDHALLGRDSTDTATTFRLAAGPGVRDWVLDLVRREGGDRRFVARTASYAVNATGLAVMIAVFASTAFIPTGLEIAAGAGTTVAAQKVLEAIFGDQAIRSLAAKARQDLLDRVDDLLDEEAARYFARIEAVGIDADPGGELRASAEAVSAARVQAELTSGDRLTLPDKRPPLRAQGPLSLPAEGPTGIAGPAS